MEQFFKGFEKKASQKTAEANSLIGVVHNAIPGLRRFSKGSTLKPPRTVNPGTFIAPRSDLPHLATMKTHDTSKNFDAVLPHNKPEVTVPKSRGIGN